MEIEKFVEWLKAQIVDGNMYRIMGYWFGFMACSVLSVLTFNVIAPPWLRWYKTFSDFCWATVLAVIFMVVWGLLIDHADDMEGKDGKS